MTLESETGEVAEAELAVDAGGIAVRELTLRRRG